MLPRSLTAVLLGLVLSAVPVRAQDAGRPEVGWFLQWTVFDGSLLMDDFFASGGRVGIPLMGPLGFEGDLSRVITNGPPGIKVTYLPIHARLTYSIPVRRSTTAILGAGYVHNSYGSSREGSDNGIAGLLGLRFQISPPLALRFDFTADYMPSPANAATGADENWNLGVRQGLNLSLGRARPKPPSTPDNDQDGDGVADRRDRCADTPAGASVNASGCPLDNDMDGVPDPVDRCPGTPSGIPVDAAGCALDSDRDGVPDTLDRCPNTPAGVPVDASGCSLDSDKDGVPNTLDRCPDTPAGTVVDAAGCALDSDGDGVPDAVDRCPSTTTGTRVDAAGCLLLFEENRKSLILEGVNFANGKADLTDESKAILDNVAASLVANSETRVAVDGHTSSTGTRQLNIRLSHARAETVKDYLIGRGVAAGRLVARGFGPDRPIASNTTAEGQAKNRRTELSKLD